jgi:hypothetical protein
MTLDDESFQAAAEVMLRVNPHLEGEARRDLLGFMRRLALNAFGDPGLSTTSVSACGFYLHAVGDQIEALITPRLVAEYLKRGEQGRIL